MFGIVRNNENQEGNAAATRRHRHRPRPGETRTYLADRLGCDEDLRAEAWAAAWRDDLIADGRSLDEAEYWLDVEFVQPCPEDRPTED